MQNKNYTFIVLTNAKPGQESEYNHWYNEVHLADVLKVPGFSSAKRFKASKGQPTGNTPRWEYAAIYEIDTDDLSATLDNMYGRVGTPDMDISEALDFDNLYAVVYESVP